MRLCKYVPPERVDILTGGRIRFTQPTVFNDPFEMSPRLNGLLTAADILADDEMMQRAQEEFDGLADDIRSRIEFDQFLEKFVEVINDGVAGKGILDEVRHTLIARFLSQTGVLTMAERPDNLLMWSHYADQHRGFVIEFDTDHPFFDQRRSDDDHFHHVRKVLYSDERPTTVLSAFLGESTLLTKSAEWEYEQEWRMLIDLDEVSHDTVQPGDDSIYLVPVPPKAITRIILGHRMLEEQRETIVEMLTTDRRFAHVEVLQAEIDEDRFALNFSGLAEHYFERFRAALQRAVRWGAAENDAERRDNWSGILAAAIPDIDRAMRLAPNEPSYPAARGVANQMMGRLEDALEDYARAVLLDPKSAEMHGARGLILAEMGRLDQAESALARALRLGMTDVQDALEQVRQAQATRAAV